MPRPAPVMPTAIFALQVMAPEHAERCAPYAMDVEIRIVRGAEVKAACGTLGACSRFGRDPKSDAIVLNVESQTLEDDLAHEVAHWWRLRCVGESRGNLDHGTKVFEGFVVELLTAAGWRHDMLGAEVASQRVE